MDVEPRIIKVNSEEELINQAEELKKQGRRVIDCNSFDKGILGKIAFYVPPKDKIESWTPQDADAIWITWEKYGRPLESDKICVIDGDKLSEMYNEHKDHPIVAFTNAEYRQAGFVCFCKQSEGKSLVFFVNLQSMKEMSPELLAAFDPQVQVMKS